MGQTALAFVRRDFQIQASYRLSFVMRLAGIMVTVTILFFISLVLGSSVTVELPVAGLDYFSYVLIGVAFRAIVSLSSGSMSDNVLRHQASGTLEMLFVSHTPLLAVLIFSSLWAYVWALAEALIYLLVAAIFFKAAISWSSSLAMLALVVLVIPANAGLSLVNTAIVLISKRPSPLISLTSVVTSLLAGVFFPAELLPPGLSFLSRLIPASYFFEGLRQALLGGASVVEIDSELAIMAVFAVVTIPPGLLLLDAAVKRAKRDGSLSQY